MTASNTRRQLEEWLQDACSAGPGCPSIEAITEAAADRLAEDARLAIETHGKECPRCAAEYDLALLFAADEAEIAHHQEDLDYVVARLEEGAGRPSTQGRAPTSGSAVIPFPSPQRSRLRFARLARIAAALILVVGLGMVVRNLGTDSPSLPALGPGEVTRGTAIEILAPQGEIDAVPTQLSWRDHPRADAYRVRLLAVDESVILEQMVGSPPLIVPPAVQTRLNPAVVYQWQVEALDENGALAAWSERISFRING